MSNSFEDIQDLNFLIVDDYESMRMLLAENLDGLGIEKIEFAKSGNEAYSFLKSKFGSDEQIQFVLTDMIMDNGTGIDLVKLVRSDENFKTLPVLMITSKAEIEYVLEASDAGVDGYIIKPWTDEALKDKLLEVFKKRS